MTDVRNIDTERERSVHDVMEELRDLLDSDAELEARTRKWLAEQMETSDEEDVREEE